MAINKRKILQSAQKYMQKGALDKALKDYGTLLEADPGDANVRLKVGDIHLKQGRTDEAIDSYLKVAQRFMKDGFDSKAIALYKQVTKIDPKRYDVYLPLSELYQRLGLKSDAMRALQTAADAHYREGDKDQALDLLRKMATFDPSNTTNRLKVAELLRQEGRETEAIAEYDEVVEELERQGDVEERVKVLEKILEVTPDRVVTLVALGSAWVEQGNWRRAEKTAQRMIDGLPAEPEGYELQAQIFQQLGREDELQGVYRRLAEVYKDRGDEDHAREIMQRFVSTEALGSDENGDPVLAEDDQLDLDAAIGGDGTLALEPDECTDAGFFSGEGLRLGEGISDSEVANPAGGPGSGETTATSLPPLPPLELESASEVEEAPEPEGDAEQLFAEASVYLRYGKHERAIESLRAVLAQDPAHRPALEKLGEALVATGDSEAAVTVFTRAAEAARKKGDDAGVESLRAKLEELDPVAAESPAAAPEVGGEAREGDASEDLETLDVDSGAEDDRPQETQGADDSIEFEIEDDFGFDEPPAAEEGAEPEARLEESLPEPDEVEFDLEDVASSLETAGGEDTEEEIDLTDPEGAKAPDREASLEETVARGAVASTRAGGSATTPQRMIEDLEEADFYFQQGLLDEAEEVYERILRAAPNHPQAMLRMGEIEAARGEFDEVLPDPEEDPVVEAVTAEAVDEAAPDEPLPDVSPSDLDADVPAPELEEEGPEPSLQADVPEPDFDLEVPEAELGAGAEESAPRSAEPTPEEEGEQQGLDIDLPDGSALTGLEEAAEPELEVDAARETAPEPVAQAEATLPLVAQAPETGDARAEEQGEVGDFDLAAELSDALSGEDTGPIVGGMAGTTEEEGFEQVFAAFKQGVQQELGEGDLETHYDLGIAYKEMGLLEDAIGEFQIALDAPARKLASLHAMGLCALDLGRVSDAVSHLEQALALPEVPVEQQTALHFDLGRAYQEKGDLARARSAYETVAAADPGFGAVGERLAGLERGESGGNADAEAVGDGEEEIFESFDDLVGAPVAEAEEEAYESFDDLMDGDEEEAHEPPADVAPPPEEAEATAPDLEVASASQPEAGERPSEPAPEPVSEAPQLEGEPAAEPEPSAWEFETEPPLEREPDAAELDAEPAPDPEAGTAPEPVAQAPAPRKPARRKKISFV